ncbi:phosphotransferase [Wielerella bovis]|uniref:N-acetylmuramate/N-acetylglucosamine kinase AmgK n=1 Tax=Wielerella bovis TaxID=2917790 RepID=UPI0020189BF0|nr:phosphotransferase [Wielerella bovis]ULJ70329.1 phosphotransferase [Wielerella bovis]
MERETLLKNWLASVYPNQNFELSFAAADADFRRYFRATFVDGSSVICMDAPPEKMRESVSNYLKVRDLFSHLNVPTVLAKDLEHGFVVLNDLGDVQYLKAMLLHPNDLAAHKALLLEAIDTLIELQQASQPNQLPEYDHATLLREINLFPEWFVAKELGRELNFAQRKLWQQTIDVLLPEIEKQPKVYVHRDFIVRNLMLTNDRPGVLDFQDALYGAITYDLVSLLRDAFIEWEEEFVLDLVIRYWEKARAAKLPVPEQFDEFYRWFEYMGVQRHLKVAGIFARLWYRDGKDKYRPEIPRFLNYLRRTSRRYVELAPLYQLLLELVGDEELQTGYTF